MLLRDGDVYLHPAGATPDGLMADLGPPSVPIDPSANVPSRAILSDNAYLPDWSRIDLPGRERDLHEMFGVNSALDLPLMREGECIGALALAGPGQLLGPSEIAQADSFRTRR